jgi:hypothetical protein
VHVGWYGARGNGEADDREAIRAAYNGLVNRGGDVLAFRERRYRIEYELNADGTPKPVLGLTLDGLTVDGNMATIVQTVEHRRSAVAVFNIQSADRVVVKNFKYEGSYSKDANTGALVYIRGASRGARVENCHVNGGEALALVQSADNTPSTPGPTDTYIEGTSRNAHYGVNYGQAGRGHVIDIETKRVLRSVFIRGTSGVEGQIKSEDARANDINISTRHGSVIEDVRLRVNIVNARQAIRIKVSDGIAAYVGDVTISGTAGSEGPAIQLTTLGNTGSTFANLDFSGLQVVSRASRAVDIVPDVAGTIRHIDLPAATSYRAHAVYLDNTVGALIEDVSASNVLWHANTTGQYGTGMTSVGGMVHDLRLIDVHVKNSSASPASPAMNIENGEGVLLRACTTDGRAIETAGSIGVRLE